MNQSKKKSYKKEIRQAAYVDRSTLESSKDPR